MVGFGHRSAKSTPAAPTTGRKPLIAGNWKMNLNHLEAIALVQKLAFTFRPQDFDAVDIAVLVPFTDLRSVQTLIDGDKLRFEHGAQDVSPHASGAYTGEISASMLAKLKCAHVLVGHSERRQHHHESDELVAAKAKAALTNGIHPMVCVGEKLPERKAGEQVEYTLNQLEGSLKGLSADEVRNVTIAYEPVWAIGTGEVATPEDAQEMAAAIRIRLAERYSGDLADAVRVLYGGSVKGDNAAGIMAGDDVDGVLVGGASLNHDDFVRICRYQQH
jgi:triosephosphate isomerase